MIKKSAILGLVLLVVGGAVFVWVRNERSKDRENIASCKLKYGSEADEYLRQYNEWLQLPPDERLGSPLACCSCLLMSGWVRLLRWTGIVRPRRRPNWRPSSTAG